MNHILTDIASRWHLHRRSGKWDGPCPQCGGSSQSNRFAIRDDGGFKCYGCDFKGDIITWLRTMEGMSCPEAHLHADKPCLVKDCPQRGGCRLGDGSGLAAKGRRQSSVAPLPGKKPLPLPITAPTSTSPLWLAWATEFAASCHRQLLANEQMVEWLSKRGIPSHDLARFGLGLNLGNASITRAEIGLPPRDGKDTLWLPKGLVVVTYDDPGQVYRLRIRRPLAERSRFLPDLKYLWLEGSGNGPMVIRPKDGPSRGVVVIEAELDGLACASARADLTIIALGTVKAGISPALHQEIAAAPVVLVALDADPGTKGQVGPGPAAIASWLQEFRQAKYWPVPMGKDPGEYVSDHGGDLSAWLNAGLPLQLSPPSAIMCQDLASQPDCQSRGAREAVFKEIAAEIPDGCVEVQLTGGRRVLVTDSQESWQAAQEQGLLVFSVGELQRAQAVGGVEALLELKDIFRGAYVGRARVEP